jgi:hypothetical protein
VFVDDWYWVGYHEASHTGAAAIANVLEDDEYTSRSDDLYPEATLLLRIREAQHQSMGHTQPATFS